MLQRLDLVRRQDEKSAQEEIGQIGVVPAF